MKIALVCDRYPPRVHSGIGTFVQMLARGLRQHGHNVLVVQIGDQWSESCDKGISVFMLPRTRLPWLGNLITRLRLRNWLAARVRRGQIELIEAPDYQGFLPFGIDRCATVVRLHQSATVSQQLAGLKAAPGIYFYEKRTLAANRNWIGVSSHILGLTCKAFGVLPKKFAVIHNGILPIAGTSAEPVELPARFVLYAGQVSRRKGSLVLAEAAREFLTSHPEVHLVYAGGCLPEAGLTPIDQEIRGRVGTELSEHVHFLGQLTREQTLAWLQRAAVFVFPALIDCFPLVVLEAMSAGTPVVFTRNPPGPELIEDGFSGLLADPANPHDFAAKTSRVLDDPILAATLSEGARKRAAERFSFEQCLKATERFYSDCVREYRERQQARHSWLPAVPIPVLHRH
ncbi:MAG TPA: glycosyltransferase family 4 protein [Terriglobales bacterium]|nr:glycosyltransferase family 4 protein [Terriglobales bacterium]